MIWSCLFLIQTYLFYYLWASSAGQWDNRHKSPPWQRWGQVRSPVSLLPANKTRDKRSVRLQWGTKLKPVARWLTDLGPHARHSRRLHCLLPLGGQLIVSPQIHAPVLSEHCLDGWSRLLRFWKKKSMSNRGILKVGVISTNMAYQSRVFIFNVKSFWT